MNKFITTDNGGLPLVLDDIRWFMGQNSTLPAGVYQAFNGLLLTFGTDFIISGCENPSGNTINAGWIMLGSEILRVDAHSKSDTYYAKVTTNDATGNKTFQSGSLVDTYQKNRGVVNAASGNLAFNGLRLEDVVRSTSGVQDRGDPAAYDFSYTETQATGSWFDIDLSSIISENFKMVNLNVYAQENNSNNIFNGDRMLEFRKNGNTNDKNVAQVYCDRVTRQQSGDIWVFVDSDRKIEARATNVPASGNEFNWYITVKGWM